ncbi:MAG: biotin-dependent carboxyltransferase [Silicimonas sp.]|nr:biotin-dependent carboxyltransferase [Silicimonas sp.]
MSVIVERAGPLVAVQDAGRAGGLGVGLSRGGAVDRLAYIEGVALLDQPLGAAALEMAGVGGRFRLEAGMWFALTGARMKATLDGAPIEGRASYLAAPGSVLDIGSADVGVYGYLHLGGGIETPFELGGRGFHRIAGLGRAVVAGDRLPVAASQKKGQGPMRLPQMAATTAPLRVMPGPQTEMFPAETRQTFEATVFHRSTRANRQGVRLDHDGAPFSVGAQLHQVSDFISEGDIQMTGDGTPYVLLAECQTMGGYPRIGTVLPADLPRIAQAVAGDEIRFRFVSVEEAEAAWKSDEALLARLVRRREPRVRDPRDMADLLRYEMIDRPHRDVVDE